MTEAETADPRGEEVTTEFGTGSGIEPREEEEAATDKLASETRERSVSEMSEETSRREEAEKEYQTRSLPRP